MKLHAWCRAKAAWLGFCLVAVWLLSHPYTALAQDNSQVGAVTPTQAGLGQNIAVQVDNASNLLKEAGCTPDQTGCLNNIILYLDGIPIKGLTPFARETISGADTTILKFQLKRTAETKEAWSQILSKPKWKPSAMSVSVGIADKPVLSSSVADFKLVVIPKVWAIFYGLLLLALLVGFGLLVKKTNLIRDSGVEPGGTQQKPYSLARSQMALWFFTVVAAYLFIGIVTGDFATSVTGTVLILLGISTGTAVVSAVVDANKGASPANQVEEQDATKKINVQLAEVATKLKEEEKVKDKPGAIDLTAQKNLLEAQKQFLKNASQGWYRDILSDANGISFPRFQIAGWTLVLGLIFIHTVYQTLAMPEFGEALLTLMGISAGAYIGFKIPEPTVPTPASQTIMS